MPPLRIQSQGNKKTARAAAGMFLAVFLFSFLLFVALSTAPAFAQDSATSAPDFGFAAVEDRGLFLSGTPLPLIIARIIRAVLGFIGIVLLIVVLYAGFLIMLSQGDEKKIALGKLTLRNAVIGLFIILSAFAIVQFVINQLARATGAQGRGGAGQQGVLAPGFNRFAGSGALGRIIQDHFPGRGATVAMNTRVALTFGEPINVASLIINQNGTCWEKDNPAECNFDGPEGERDTEKLGDCLQPDEGFDPRGTGRVQRESRSAYICVPAVRPAGHRGPDRDVPRARGKYR